MVGRFETIEYPVAVQDRLLRLLGPKDSYYYSREHLAPSQASNEHFSRYWTTPWPAARMLGEYMVNHLDPGPSTVLEIGAGLGLAGLIAALFDFRVLMTDYNPQPLDFIRATADLNEIKIEPPRVLDWRQPPTERYALVVAADAAYKKDSVPEVIQFLETTLADQGVALIADPNRDAPENVEALLAKAGFASERIPAECKAIPRSGSIDGRTFRGQIYRIRRQ